MYKKEQYLLSTLIVHWVVSVFISSSVLWVLLYCQTQQLLPACVKMCIHNHTKICLCYTFLLINMNHYYKLLVKGKTPCRHLQKGEMWNFMMHLVLMTQADFTGWIVIGFGDWMWAQLLLLRLAVMAEAVAEYMVIVPNLAVAALQFMLCPAHFCLNRQRFIDRCVASRLWELWDTVTQHRRWHRKKTAPQPCS